MRRIITIFCLFIAGIPVIGQVEKEILCKSTPDGSRVLIISGVKDYIGNTPLKHSFAFHSDMSMLKIKLSACGYYDTIVKVTPATDSLNIRLQKKRFLILPETENDLFPENDLKNISAIARDFLNDFSKRNKGAPINYSDFAIIRKTGDRIVFSLMFEIDPLDLPVPRVITSDSLSKVYWDKWFAKSSVMLKKGQTPSLKNLDICISLIAGKKGVSVRHLPGVEVHDEMKTDVYVSENDYERVTTTVTYYETVTNPTFDVSVYWTDRYNELLYKLSPSADSKTYRLAQTAVVNSANNKLKVLFESEPGIGSASVLTKFVKGK